VFPSTGAYVTTEQAKRDYYDSLYYSGAVVGINTTAMIEAGIVGRVSHTIRDPQFAETQDGTLHFAYLVRDGFVKSAADFKGHVRQLGETLRSPSDARSHVDRFIASFVRPQGLDRPSTPVLVDAIEELNGIQRSVVRVGLAQACGRIGLLPAAIACHWAEVVWQWYKQLGQRDRPKSRAAATKHSGVTVSPHRYRLDTVQQGNAE
jgi:hypothetical protein